MEWSVLRMDLSFYDQGQFMTSIKETGIGYKTTNIEGNVESLVLHVVSVVDKAS